MLIATADTWDSIRVWIILNKTAERRTQEKNTYPLSLDVQGHQCQKACDLEGQWERIGREPKHRQQVWVRYADATFRCSTWLLSWFEPISHKNKLCRTHNHKESKITFQSSGVSDLRHSVKLQFNTTQSKVHLYSRDDTQQTRQDILLHYHVALVTMRRFKDRKLIKNRHWNIQSGDGKPLTLDNVTKRQSMYTHAGG